MSSSASGHTTANARSPCSRVSRWLLTRSLLSASVVSQSNMEVSVIFTFGGAEAIADSIHHQSIRLFGVAWAKTATAANDTTNRWGGGSWRLASPDSLYCGPDCPWYYFASTCYYYGLAIDNALQGQVPLGLMQVTYGGTWVEEWTRAEVVPQCGPVPHPNSTTGQIWNAMVRYALVHHFFSLARLCSLLLMPAFAAVCCPQVSPLINYTASVTLWYQVRLLHDAKAHSLCQALL
jgi:hypothetical protein